MLFILFFACAGSCLADTLLRRATLQDCLTGIPAQFPGSVNYTSLATPYNLRLSYQPKVIVQPQNSQQVSKAVLCAGQYNVKVQARSGGHGYASFSSGGQNGSMVIDLVGFQTIAVNASNYVATVGAGVRLGNLASAIYNQSRRALPHGTCPGVGIGGHATHGGFGLSSRAWGLTLDTIVSMEVVLADGSIAPVSKTERADLWYALRGAASDFGIITAFNLQTVPAPSEVIVWKYDFANLFSSYGGPSGVLQHVQNFAQNSSVVDRNLGMTVYLDGTQFAISGTYFGSLTTWQTKLAPELLRGLPNSSAQVTSMGWIDSLVSLAGNQSLPQNITDYTAKENFYAKSVVSPTALSAAQLDQYMQYIVRNSTVPGSWFSIFNLYGGPDSQINVPDSNSSAYSDRSALWVVQHYGRAAATAAAAANYSQANIDFVNGLNTALTSLMASKDGVSFTAYPNYVDPSLSAAAAHQLYYGNATYARLLATKRSVDPAQTFWNPQSVGN